MLLLRRRCCLRHVTIRAMADDSARASYAALSAASVPRHTPLLLMLLYASLLLLMLRAGTYAMLIRYTLYAERHAAYVAAAAMMPYATLFSPLFSLLMARRC